MKTPICPILLFYEGDEYKCNKNKCNYNAYKKVCTMKCLRKRSLKTEYNNFYKNWEVIRENFL